MKSKSGIEIWSWGDWMDLHVYDLLVETTVPSETLTLMRSVIDDADLPYR